MSHAWLVGWLVGWLVVSALILSLVIFLVVPLSACQKKLKASIFMRLHLEGLCGHLSQGVVAGRPIVLRGSPCEARCDKVEQGIW